MRRIRRPTGFTIVELLVVITIIVVLLALLVPALDRAIYEADLAVCATRLHGIATGAITYTVDHRRAYPHRSGLSGSWKPNYLYVGGAWSPVTGRGPDDRPVLREYMSVNGHLNDPLCDTVDFEAGEMDALVEASYNLWFGFRYARERGLLKLGDRLEYMGDQFDFLASDRDVISEQFSFVHGSHPDDEGVLSLLTFENDSNVPGLKSVFSRWDVGGRPTRGALDMNFVAQDGAVSRAAGIPQPPAVGSPEMARHPLVPLPEFSDDAQPGIRTYLLRR